MAYVFNAISQQLEDNKSNIFNNQPSEGAGAQQPSQAPMGGGGATTGQSGPRASKQPQPVSTQQQQANINKAAAKAQTPKTVGNLQTSLQGAKQNVQNEANQYLQTAQNKSYDVGKDVLSKAAEGDQTALQNTQQALYGGAGTADQFKPQSQYQFQGIQDIQTDPGIRAMYKKEVGPQYSRGESAFDSMLLQRNPEFQKTRAELLQQQNALTQDVGKLQDTETQEAQKALEANYARDVGNMRTGLEGLGQGILDPLSKQAEEINARRAGLDINSIAAQREAEEALNIQNQLLPGGKSLLGRAGMMLQDPGLRSSIIGGINPQQFIQRGKTLSAQDLAQQADAEKYNRIMGLLHDQRSLQAGGGAGEDISQNIGGLDEAIKNAAIQARQAKDAQQQALLNQMQDSLGGQAQMRMTSRDQDIMNQYKAAIQQAANAASQANTMQGVTQFGQAIGANTGKFKDVWDPKNNDPNAVRARNILGNQDLLKQYSNYGQKLGFQDMLDTNQANQFNQILQDLGSDPMYHSGALGSTQFNQGALQDYLKGAFGVTNAAQAATQAPTATIGGMPVLRLP